MNPEEEMELSRAQGGREFHENLPFPSLDKLSSMIMENPEIRTELSKKIQQTARLDPQQQQQLEQQVDAKGDQEQGALPPPMPQSQNPAVSELEGMGEGDDHEIVVMPKHLLEFLWDSVPENERQVNPKSGLPMFFGWPAILSVVGGLLGSMLPGVGNVIGAGLGSAAGHIGGKYISEAGLPEDQKTSFMEKLGGGAMAGGLGAMGAGLYNTIGGQMPAEMAKKAAETNIAPSFFEKLMGNSGYAPYIAGGGMLFQGASQEEREKEAAQKFQQEELQKRQKLEQEHMLRMREREGQHDLEKRHHELENQRAYENYMKRFFMTASKFKEGLKTNLKDGGAVEIVKLPPLRESGLIKGRHGGQEDNIHVKVPRGSYVLDARTVADFGDGNTEAGEKNIHEYLRSQPDYHDDGDHEDIDCGLSCGEFVLMPADVKKYGDGSVEDGHKVLDGLAKEQRKHKANHHTSIPKPSKGIEYYIAKMSRRAS